MFGPNVRTEKDDFNNGTWVSLLDLLHPYEFFIPMDQTTLWRRHVAWAKPKGKDIRDYVIQRFSSNMVFLSLLLGTDMSVLMNSSKITTEIREALMLEQYDSLKFYVGALLALASCVTVVGLVATYTSWSMISVLSDANSNCMLRSSMGQYVTAMPSRFVVASLYLFLAWLILLLVEIISGPLMFAMVCAIAFLFFQVIVSLSAFGRLIIHTGAMGQKRILDPELERQLLPSGLHASLLIKATERSRRNTSATEQYRPSVTTQKSPRQDRNNSHKSYDSYRDRLDRDYSHRSYDSQRSRHDRYDSHKSTDSHRSRQDREEFQRHHPDRDASESSQHSMPTLPESDLPFHESGSLVSEENHALENAARAFGFEFPSDVPATSSPSHLNSRHVRAQSSESIISVDELVNQIDFPRASFLNRTNNNQLKDVVNETLSSRQNDDLIAQAKAALEEEEENCIGPQGLSVSTGMQTQAGRNAAGKLGDDTPRTATRKLAVRRSRMVSDSSLLKEEWLEEDDVRQVYDIEPPVEIFQDGDDGDGDRNDAGGFMPRASLLNRTHDIGSLRRLVTKGIGGLGRSLSRSRIMVEPRRLSGSGPLGRISEKGSMEDLSADIEDGKKHVHFVKVDGNTPTLYDGESDYLLDHRK